MTALEEALTRLATQKPQGVFSPHYIDEVQRVAKWALDALSAAEEALMEKGESK